MDFRALFAASCPATLLVARATLAQQSTPIQTGSIPDRDSLRERRVAEVEEMLGSSGRIMALVVKVDVPCWDDREVVVPSTGWPFKVSARPQA